MDASRIWYVSSVKVMHTDQINVGIVSIPGGTKGKHIPGFRCVVSIEDLNSN